MFYNTPFHLTNLKYKINWSLMSRSLQDLHPEIHWWASKVIQAAQEIRVPILIYFTLRTFAEQEVLYAIGRTEPGKIKTNARGGESYHNYGLAFDFAIDPSGPGIEWASGVDINDDKIPDYRQIGEIGEDFGLQWGGRFKSIKGDYGHLQFSFGFSIHALRLLYGLGGLPRVWAEISAKNEKNKWP